ncbi:MAG: hypothetical protein AB8F94_13960 [Saprospiraceae bacterium]
MGFLFLMIFSFSFCKNEKPKEPTSPSTPPQEAATENIPVAPTDAFIKKYQGKIGDKYPIELVLINWSNGNLGGYYFYSDQVKTDKKGNQIPQKIELSGELNLDETFSMDEFAGDDFTGKFTGSLAELSNIKGNWSNADSSTSMNYILTEISIKDTTGWTGAWYRNEAQSPGMLILGNVTDKTVDFGLEIFNGGHSGLLEGTAKLNGGIATFENPIFDNLETCFLVFQKHDSLVLIDQKSSNWACGFGMRAHANGKYENYFSHKEPELSYGKKNSIFQTKDQRALFIKLVGDRYEDFAFNMQDIVAFPKNEKDDFDATVFAGNVIGLASTNEAIIMKNGKGIFWAAVIIYDEITDQFQVKYFTNDEQRKEDLPQTIEDWRDSFSEYEIVL